MFATSKAFSSFSTPDIAAAKRFYGGTLGLEVDETPMGLELHLGSGADVFVYPSTDYTPPEHTVLNFPVDDIDQTIDALAKKGVRMEQYDLPDIKTDARGVFRNGKGDGPKAIAWFKDPADHILSIVQER